MIAWLKSWFANWRAAPNQQQLDAVEAGLDPDIREVFLEELDETLTSLQATLPVWKANRRDPAALKQLRRDFHTIKGSAKMVNAGPIGLYCRDLERLVILFTDHPMRMSPEAMYLLERSVPVLAQYIESIRTNAKAPPEAATITAKVRKIVGN